jgi:hypothetical protein
VEVKLYSIYVFLYLSHRSYRQNWTSNTYWFKSRWIYWWSTWLLLSSTAKSYEETLISIYISFDNLNNIFLHLKSEIYWTIVFIVVQIYSSHIYLFRKALSWFSHLNQIFYSMIIINKKKKRSSYILLFQYKQEHLSLGAQ